MNKIIISAVLPLVSFSAKAADTNTLCIKSTLKGFNSDTLIVYSSNHRDTILVKNDSFTATLNFPKVQGFYLLTPATLRHEDNKALQLLAVPGETMELTGDISDHYYVSGSTYYKQYNEADRMLEPLQDELNKYVMSLRQRLDNGESQEVINKEYSEKVPALQQKVTDATLNFIKEHPDYDCSAQLITTLEDYKDMEAAEKMLSEKVKFGRLKEYYQGYMDRVLAQKRAEEEAAKAQAPGVEAPDFTLNDIDGKPLSLSSFRGKYVLIDFWGSWCVWCIKGFPQLKEYYNKYPGKFEVLGVDCRDSQEKWKAAVKKHELPWKHVYNPADSNVLDLYKVQGFPTKILVGPDGKIVKTVVGEDPSFFSLFDDLFGK